MAIVTSLLYIKAQTNCLQGPCRGHLKEENISPQSFFVLSKDHIMRLTAAASACALLCALMPAASGSPYLRRNHAALAQANTTAGSPTWYFSQHRTRRSATLAGPTSSHTTPLWTFNANYLQFASPAVAGDGTVYIGDASDGNLYALVGDTGRLKWSGRVSAEGLESSPAISNDGSLVYVGGDDDRLYGVNATTGRFETITMTDGSILGAATVGANGVVYVGSDGYRMLAIDGTTGSIKASWISCLALFARASLLFFPVFHTVGIYHS